MSITLIATYESGILRLPRFLNLPEHSRVQVQIESLPEVDAQPTSHVLQQLLTLATDLGVDDLAEHHDHYLYGVEKSDTAHIP